MLDELLHSGVLQPLPQRLQLHQQFLHGLEALGIIFAEGLVHHSLQFGGAVGSSFAEGAGLFIDDVQNQGRVIVAGKRFLVAQQLVEHHAD